LGKTLRPDREFDDIASPEPKIHEDVWLSSPFTPLTGSMPNSFNAADQFDALTHHPQHARIVAAAENRMGANVTNG
jgi:hypothetical protein